MCPSQLKRIADSLGRLLLLWLGSAALLLPIAHNAMASGSATQVAQASNQNPNTEFSPSQHPIAKAMAQRLEQRGLYSADAVLTLLKDAKYMPSVVRAIRPATTPTVRNWDTYRQRFIEPTRIQKGKRFWQQHARIFQEAEQRYGVPQSVMVAIIGIETLYGEHIGNFRVLDALSTLAFAFPPGQRDRSEFFQKELEAFFVLCQQVKLDPTEVKGSFAGAVGLGQFMPSSWLNFAVDGNQDGRVDLFHTPEDAILSVGNFLKVHGWNPNASGLIGMQWEHTDYLEELTKPDIVPTFTSTQLAERGVRLNTAAKGDEKLAVVELPRGSQSPAYIVGGQNFYAVTRYNRSAFYAGAVLQLADALDEAMQAKR